MKLSVIHGMFKMKINGDSMCNDVGKEQVNVIKDGAMQFHSESMNCIKFQFFINSLPIKKRGQIPVRQLCLSCFDFSIKTHSTGCRWKWVSTV